MIRVLQSEQKSFGRPFEPVGELALRNGLQTLSQGLAGEGTICLAVSEVHGPFGVADIVILVGDSDNLTPRIQSLIPPLLNEIDAGIVALLTPHKGKSVTDLLKLLPLSRNFLEVRVQALRNVGAIINTSSGRLVRHEALVPVGLLHAVEFKVRNWRQALDQARTYALWADSASAVLAHLPRNHEHVHDAASFARVGLALGTEWLRQPPIRRHTPARRLWASEHFIAAAGSRITI